MKTIQGVQVIESIDDFLHDEKLSNRYYNQSAEKDNDFINEPERAERCHDAASDGSDGKYHWEVIDDFREFGGELLKEAERAIDDAVDAWELWDTNPTAAQLQRQAVDVEFQQCRLVFDKDCDELEQWHRTNGSYEQQIG